MSQFKYQKLLIIGLIIIINQILKNVMAQFFLSDKSCLQQKIKVV